MSDYAAGGSVGPRPENSSGEGPSAVLPPELEGLNWGAFALNWIWGLGNRTYIALLTLLPVLNVAMPFVLLFKGNQWAWQNERWRDAAHFRRVQRNWGIAAAVVYGFGASVLIGAFAIVFSVAFSLEPVDMVKREARTNPEIARHLGTPVEPSWWFSGSIQTRNRSGDADVTVSVSGPLGSGTLRSISLLRGGVWTVRKMVLTLDDGGAAIAIAPSPDPGDP